MLDMITGIAKEDGWKVEVGAPDMPIEDNSVEKPHQKEEGERTIPVN